MVTPSLGLMGNKPLVSVAPEVLEQLERERARLLSALGNSGLSKLAIPSGFSKYLESQQEKFAPFVEAGKKWKEKIFSLLSKVKSWRKKFFVLPLKFVLKHFKIFITFIEPSSGKVLQLPNSYRSHSPPFYGVIV